MGGEVRGRLVAQGRLERGSAAERALATEQVGRLGVLVASDDVKLAPERERERLADGRLAGAGLADEQYGLVAVQTRGDEVVEAAHRTGPDEAVVRGRGGEASVAEAREVVEGRLVDLDLPG